MPGNRGFDSLGLKYNTNGTIQEIVILESKYSKRGVAQLSNTQKGKQMGPEWIKNTLDEMMRSGNSYLEEMAEIIKKNKDKVILKGHVLGADGVNRVEDLTRKINALHQKTLKKEP